MVVLKIGVGFVREGRWGIGEVEVPELEEEAEGAGDLAVETGFVAVGEADHGGLFGEVAVGAGVGVADAAGLGELVADGEVHGLGFDFADAGTAPMGGDEVVDEEAGDGVGGAQGGMHLRGEVLKGLGVFGFEEDVFGEGSVFDGVLGGTGFALGSDRAAGFGAVGAGGGDAAGGAGFGGGRRRLRGGWNGVHGVE